MTVVGTAVKVCVANLLATGAANEQPVSKSATPKASKNQADVRVAFISFLFFWGLGCVVVSVYTK